jgi:hypothetical protein
MKKGNNSKMGYQIYFKIAGQIFDIINGFWVITKNLQFYHMFYF